jgi:hypothetical protein
LQYKITEIAKIDKNSRKQQASEWLSATCLDHFSAPIALSPLGWIVDRHIFHQCNLTAAKCRILAMPGKSLRMHQMHFFQPTRVWLSPPRGVTRKPLHLITPASRAQLFRCVLYSEHNTHTSTPTP